MLDLKSTDCLGIKIGKGLLRKYDLNPGDIKLQKTKLQLQGDSNPTPDISRFRLVSGKMSHLAKSAKRFTNCFSVSSRIKTRTTLFLINLTIFQKIKVDDFWSRRGCFNFPKPLACCHVASQIYSINWHFIPTTPGFKLTLAKKPSGVGNPTYL